MRHIHLQVEGLRAHLVTAGQGPPVVLLHGLGASWCVWRPTITALAGRFSAYAVDLPGHGDTDKGPFPPTPEFGLAFLRGLLDALGLERPHLVGNSLGGFLALKWALAHPERASHLALVAPAGLGRQVNWVLRLATLPLLYRFLERPGLEGTRGMVRAMFHDPSRIPPGLVEELHRARSLPGARQAVLRILRHAVGLAGVRRPFLLLGELGNLQAPLLLVWGREDRVFPCTQGVEAVRRAPRGVLKVFPQCGHWPQLEHPQAFNALLLDFLSLASPATL